ncbi:uncharacterized protein METZ01_LOCUS348004, partial [marine metagenome]
KGLKVFKQRFSGISEQKNICLSRVLKEGNYSRPWK